jgi:TRAP-type C4-dicarboxylate transport system permease small subunit
VDQDRSGLATFIGFALAMRHGTDIRVDLADHFLPRKLLLVVNTVFDSLLLVLIGILCFKTAQLWDVSGIRQSSVPACRWRRQLLVC